MKFQTHKRPALQPDLTPLIDCTFQLLIFFAVTTTFAARPGIQVRLPQSTAAEIQAEEKRLLIAIGKEGEVTVEGRRISIQDLGTALASHAEPGPKGVVLLEADEEVRHGIVVSVMDALKQAGFSRLGIMTRPSRASPKGKPP